MDERYYYLGFRIFPGIGSGKFTKLLDYFKSAKNAWGATEAELNESGIGKNLASQFVDFRQKFSISEYAERLAKQKVKFCTMDDETYPKNLSVIENPPIVLFYRGKPDQLNDSGNNMRIAVVGSRRVTSYGRQVTEFLVKDLVHEGCLIISGLALGVDAISHKTTIDNKGMTVAVLGNGVEQCFPRENQSIYNSILQTSGAIVSEYPPGTIPSKGSFPSRNRIIAGLSDAVIVTEGTEDSGSLITANDATKQGKKVFAVPGPITSIYSKGPNKLIANGAIPAMSANDILKNLSISSKKVQTQIKADTKDEQLIVDLLMVKNMHINEIVKSVNLPVSKINIILSLMELKGVIKSTGTGMFGMNLV